jgi:uncharacterized membrane protein YraQ (UPF0718 family)
MNVKAIIKNKLVVVTLSLYFLALLLSRNLFTQSLKNTSHYLTEMLQVMPVIFMLTVLIEVWISKESIIKYLGEGSGIKGFGFSVILGSLSAGPIYAAFPICKMLLSKGASVYNVVVIISAWAVIKVPMLANEAKFLGPRFMAIRWVLTILTIYIMGCVCSMFVKKEDILGSGQAASAGLSINTDYCISCGICIKMLPEVYGMNEGKAWVKLESMDSVDVDSIMKTIDKCPTKAIVFHKEGASLEGKAQYITM